MTRPPRRRDLWPSLHRRQPAAVIAAIILAAVIVYLRWRQPAPPASSDQQRYDNQTAICTEAVDGDTLHVNIPDGPRAYTRVRLWGVDTPEIAHGDQKAMHFGPQAHQFTRSRVLNQRVRLVLVPNNTRDRYQRLLAYVYYGQPEEMLNEQLVAEGYAYADPRFNHPWKQRFLELEERARRDKVGLWAKVTPEQMPPWRRPSKPKASPPS